MTIKRQTTRVSAYRTTDGQVFQHKPVARQHQAELDLRELVDSLPMPTPDADADMGGAIIEAADKWLAALTELVRAHAAAVGLDEAA